MNIDKLAILHLNLVYGQSYRDQRCILVDYHEDINAFTKNPKGQMKQWNQTFTINKP